jgi:hypothetical protein
MKGNNELRLNQATLIEAVQEYLAKRYTPTPKVNSVELSKEGYGDPLFLVKVEEQHPKETP